MQFIFVSLNSLQFTCSF